MVDAVADFSTLPWLLDRGRGPCLARQRPSRDVFLCVCIVHSVVWEDKMVGSQVFPSRSRVVASQVILGIFQKFSFSPGFEPGPPELEPSV